jgi:hypothetical protein
MENGILFNIFWDRQNLPSLPLAIDHNQSKTQKIIKSLEKGLVTADGTKILTVEKYDRFITAIPESMKAIFEINMITGLRYIELQRLYENPQWYYKQYFTNWIKKSSIPITISNI